MEYVIFIVVVSFAMYMILKHKQEKLHVEKDEFERYREEELKKIETKNTQLDEEKEVVRIEKQILEEKLATKDEISQKSFKEIAVDTLFEIRELSKTVEAIKGTYYQSNHEILDSINNLELLTSEEVSEVVENALSNNEDDYPDTLSKDDISEVINDALDNLYIPSSVDYSNVENAVSNALSSYFEGEDFDSIKDVINSLEYTITSKIDEVKSCDSD